MTDDFRQRLTDAVPSPPSATGQADAARRSAAGRRRRRKVMGSAGIASAVVAVILPVAGLTSDDDNPVSAGVTCSGGSIVTGRSDRPRTPSYDSPRAAAEAWAGPGNANAVVLRGDHSAVLERPDGSVRARVRIEESVSEDSPDDPPYWTVDGSVVCSDEQSTDDWSGGAALNCPSPLQVVRARVAYPDVQDRSFPTSPEGLRVEPNDVVGTPMLTRGARSGDATTITTRGGIPQIVVREARVADRWRIDRIAACLPGPPNLDGTFPHPGDWQVERVRVGHCSVAPLEYRGKTWTVIEDDDFGSGGGLPRHWFGYGIVFFAGGTGLRYLDLGGESILFVEPGSPDALPDRPCA